MTKNLNTTAETNDKIDFRTPAPWYLWPPSDSNWVWSASGESIDWVEIDEETPGGVAVFTLQLHQVLSIVYRWHQGLPPLGTVMEIMAACQGRYDQGTNAARLYRAANRFWEESMQNEVAVSLSDFLTNLRAELPEVTNPASEVMAAVIGIVIQQCESEALVVRGSEAEEVLDWVKHASELPGERFTSMPVERNQHRVRKAYQLLYEISLQGIGYGEVERQLKTAVSSRVQLEETVELPPTDSGRGSIITALQHDPKWASLGDAAQNFASMVSIPCRPSDQENLPCGGMSDLTNRGNPEQLLATELAQEPMVMLARIANGQALYLRREQPPAPTPESRIVFIESSIRTWGDRRVSICAVAVGVLAKTSKTGKETVRLITVTDDDWSAEDFSDVDGVNGHLERLSDGQHPAGGIEDWLASLEPTDLPLVDPVLILCAATDRDPEFRTRLANSLQKSAARILVARVEDNQTVSLIERTSTGDQVYQSIALSPIKIGNSKKANTDGSNRLPKSWQQLTYPCRLPFFSNSVRWYCETGLPSLLIVTDDRRLVHADQHGQGVVELCSAVPTGRFVATEFSKETFRLVHLATDGIETLWHIDLNDNQINRVRIASVAGDKPNFQFDQGSLLRFNDNLQGRNDLEVELINDRGEVQDSIKFDEPTYFSQSSLGPVVVCNRLGDPRRGYKVVVAQAGRLVAEPGGPSDITDSDRYCASLRLNSGVLVHLDRNFLVFETSDSLRAKQTLTRVGSEWLAEITSPEIRFRSPESNLIAIGCSKTKYSQQHIAGATLVEIDFDQRTMTNLSKVRKNHFHDYRLRTQHWLEHRQVIRRLKGVSIIGGRLILFTNNSCWQLTPPEVQSGNSSPLDLRKHFGLKKANSNQFAPRQFSRARTVSTPHGQSKWDFRSIEFGGNQIIIDSRGLLHLVRGSDGSEVSLILDLAGVAGWASWGQRFGTAYYLGENPSEPSQLVCKWLEEFLIECQ